MKHSNTAAASYMNALCAPIPHALCERCVLHSPNPSKQCTCPSLFCHSCIVGPNTTVTCAAAKMALRQYLASNELNKAIKKEAQQKTWEEDQRYQKAWTAQLDRQEAERLEK